MQFPDPVCKIVCLLKRIIHIPDLNFITALPAALQGASLLHKAPCHCKDFTAGAVIYRECQLRCLIFGLQLIKNMKSTSTPAVNDLIRITYCEKTGLWFFQAVDEL